MSKSRLVAAFVAPLLALAVGSRSPAVAPPEDDYVKAAALIKPSILEHQWTKIPWLISVADGQKKAAAEGKPLLLAKAAQGCVVSCL